MRQFSFVAAWRSGVRFVSGAFLNRTILLVGLGVLLPLMLQVLLFGRPTAMMDSAATAAAGPATVVRAQFVTAAGYVLQIVGFFASLRLGLARGETLRGALLFGLLAGLMVSFGFGVVLVVLGIVFGLIAVVPLILLVVLVVVGAFLAIAWTAAAALFGVGICILFLFALAFGAVMGDMTLAATMVGGSGAVWTILVGASLLLLWVAGRLSCTTVLMAERRSFNLPAAMRDSWSLTWDDEWRIMRYLAVLGLLMAVATGGVIAAVGASLVASLGGTGQPMAENAGAMVLMVLAVPLAYLTVMVPTGIYRELAPAPVEAEVFA